MSRTRVTGSVVPNALDIGAQPAVTNEFKRFTYQSLLEPNAVDNSLWFRGTETS